MDYGNELSKVLKQLRTTFIRTADGGKIISNHLLYNQLEQESERLQRLIGLENKKMMAGLLKCKTKDVDFVVKQHKLGIKLNLALC